MTTRLPTLRQLEALRVDGPKVLEAHIASLEDAKAKGKSAADRRVFQRAIRRAEDRWAEAFGADDARRRNEARWAQVLGTEGEA